MCIPIIPWLSTNLRHKLLVPQHLAGSRNLPDMLCIFENWRRNIYLEHNLFERLLSQDRNSQGHNQCKHLSLLPRKSLPNKFLALLILQGMHNLRDTPYSLLTQHCYNFLDHTKVELSRLLRSNGPQCRGHRVTGWRRQSTLLDTLSAQLFLQGNNDLLGTLSNFLGRSRCTNLRHTKLD